MSFVNDTVSWPNLLVFNKKWICLDFRWISNIVIKTVKQSVQILLTHCISIINNNMPIILLDFKTSGFVVKSIPLVSISCFVYLMKNPYRQNILEFPISSLRHYIGDITFIKLSFLNELTYWDELETILKIFFSRFFISLIWMKRRLTFFESETGN